MNSKKAPLSALLGVEETVTRSEISLTPKTGKVLLAAILVGAVEEMQKYVRNGRKTRHYSPKYYRVKAWMDSDVHDGPFDFSWICLKLKREPEYVRRIAYNPGRKMYHAIPQNDDDENDLEKKLQG